jgi:hypothetical protein
MIDTAHGLGIMVVMDCVHSHASTNTNDGIHMFDGTDHCYSHAGTKGYHSSWDSMIFDYSKYEVKRFLLSNLAWFMQEYFLMALEWMPLQAFCIIIMESIMDSQEIIVNILDYRLI